MKWDHRFLRVAFEIASWSKEPSTQCGCVIVNPEKKKIVSTGYNGFARKCDDWSTFYEDREVKYSRILHAEVNAILQAEQPLDGYTLYVVPFPTCDRCAAQIIQSGITRVVYYLESPDRLERWQEAIDSARKMYHEAGVKVESYTYLKKGNVL
jgi:dCMP deaminase